MHFGANQGAVPREYYVAAKEGPCEDDDRDLLVGAVFAVRGRDEDFKLFKGTSREPPPKRARGMPRPKAQQPGGAADRVRARLKQLGACVVERDAKGAKKLAPTHVIVPEGTEKGQLIGLDVLVRVRTESWLIKRCRALDAGALAPPPREAVELAAKKAQGPPKEKAQPDKGPRGETDAGPRPAVPARRTRTHPRARSPAIAWVERRDETRRVPGRVPRAAAAARLRRVRIDGQRLVMWRSRRSPCTCPYAVSHPTKVCKHRFRRYRVLKIPRDDDQQCS